MSCQVRNCTEPATCKDYCDNHGHNRCIVEGCYYTAASVSEFCKTHGGGLRCKHVGCPKSAARPTDFCKQHGGARRCQHNGCVSSAEGKTDFCKKHGGDRRCTHTGCANSAQGATDLCMSHGGGLRCQYAGCEKASQRRSKFCFQHGGGLVCKQHDCENMAYQQGLCRAHGGGRHCAKPGCTKCAQGASKYCAEHGGGHRCASCALYSVKQDGLTCSACRVGVARMKHQEEEVAQQLQQWNMFCSERDRALLCQGQGCHKRPDFLFCMPDHAVIVEVDEDYHRHYSVECEIGRIGIIKDNMKVPVVFVRYHPGSRKHSMLKWVLNFAFASRHVAINEFGIYVFYVGYPRHRVDELKQDEAQLLDMPFPSVSF